MKTTTPPPTTTAVNRVRHQPTPRDPSIPPTMRVSVEVIYVQSCPDCRRIVEQLASSCIADATVTGFRATPGRKHAHDVAEGAQSLPGLTTVNSAAAMPISDTNGSNPEEVEAELFNEAVYGDESAFAVGRINGFDSPGRA